MSLLSYQSLVSHTCKHTICQHFPRYCEARSNALLNHVNEGYDKDWWLDCDSSGRSSNTVDTNSSDEWPALAMSRVAGDWIIYNPFTIVIHDLRVELTRFVIVNLRNFVRIFRGGGR